MAQYKCKTTFISSRGKKYVKGDKISSYDYKALYYWEQKNFTMEEDESSSSNGSAIDSIQSYFNFGSSDTDSASGNDFGGFGGGDTGGGGAGGDW